MSKATATRKSQLREESSERISNSLAQAPTAGAGYRFSGHQTFPLRITWIPKAVREILRGTDPLNDIDEGITKLGLGKNMVEALRCWIEAFQIAKFVDGKWTLSPIGSLLFHPKDGLDPYLEDVSTAWTLHWLITTRSRSPFFAWECLFNRWPATEFTASQVLDAFHQEGSRLARPVSQVTLRQHWEVFLHSYRPSRAGRGEDHLDSALSALRLIREFGERPNASGRWETVYAFEGGRKASISQQVYAFFVHDWWNRDYPAEQTVPLGQLAHGDRSPGRLLKMQETEVIHRVASLAARQPKVFEIVESMNLRQLRRLRPSDGWSDLKAAYRTPTFI